MSPVSSTWKRQGDIYSQISNPTVAALEERLAGHLRVVGW